MHYVCDDQRKHFHKSKLSDKHAREMQAGFLCDTIDNNINSKELVERFSDCLSDAINGIFKQDMNRLSMGGMMMNARA